MRHLDQCGIVRGGDEFDPFRSAIIQARPEIFRTGPDRHRALRFRNPVRHHRGRERHAVEIDAGYGFR